MVMVNRNDAEDTVVHYLDYFLVYYFSLRNQNYRDKSQSDDMQLLYFVSLGKVYFSLYSAGKNAD